MYRKKMYKECCKGCKLSKRIEKPRRGKLIVELDGNWILNHYGGEEGFLGWMILQPKYHRMELTDLYADEAAAVGRNIQQIDEALRAYWQRNFRDDCIERVYIVYFFESVFDDPQTKWHLHIHLIPRTVKLGKGKYGKGKPSENAAWGTVQLTSKWWFPEEYRIWDKEGKEMEEEKVRALMKDLKSKLKAK